MIYNVSILGKANEPLFVLKSSVFGDASEEDIHMNAAIFSSLDILEEKVKRITNVPQNERPMELYLGQLLAYADFKVIGLATNTGIKILLACDISTVDHGPVKEAIMQIYSKFIETTMNPFHVLESPLISSKFHSSVQQIVNNR